MASSANAVVLVGSLRKESPNRKIANALIALSAAPLKFEFAEFGHLLLYNQDLDGDNPPTAWIASRHRIFGCILFAALLKQAYTPRIFPPGG